MAGRLPTELMLRLQSILSVYDLLNILGKIEGVVRTFVLLLHKFRESSLAERLSITIKREELMSGDFASSLVSFHETLVQLLERVREAHRAFVGRFGMHSCRLSRD